MGFYQIKPEKNKQEHCFFVLNYYLPTDRSWWANACNVNSKHQNLCVGTKIRYSRCYLSLQYIKRHHVTQKRESDTKFCSRQKTKTMASSMKIVSSASCQIILLRVPAITLYSFWNSLLARIANGDRNATVFAAWLVSNSFTTTDFFFVCADYSSDVGLDYRACRSSTRTAIRSVGQQLCLRRH